MIEAIQVAAADPSLAMPAARPAGEAQASAYDVRAFAAALERGGAAQPTQVGATPQLAQSAPSEGVRAVLGALENLNGGAVNINALSQSMSASAADLTPAEMIQMTMRCHQFLFTCELTSNVANRSSDGIQQLFRQQS